MGEPGSIPSGSVSKIKAQLRQTKRLLARDDLTPDVRTTSERRIEALEAELVKAEKGNLEKKMVSRYRGVKFFERQKLLRKIKQAKKQLAETPGDDKLETQLLEARIDLHYVLRFPKTDKYVALFPDGSYVPHLTSSPSSSSSAAASTDAESKRQALRASIRAHIERGELPVEAEGGDLGIEGEEDVGSGPEKRDRDEEDGEPKGKRRRVEAPPVLVAAAKVVVEQEDEENEEEEPTAAAAGEEAPKKLNRKQKKELKRAQEAAAASGGGGAVASPAAAPVKKAAAGGKAAGKKEEKKEDRGKALAEEDDFFA